MLNVYIIVLYTLCTYFMNQNFIIICGLKEIDSPPVLKIDRYIRSQTLGRAVEK